MAAMIFSWPPQFEQCFRSRSKISLEQLGPTQPHRAAVRTGRLALNGLCFLGGRGGCMRHLLPAPQTAPTARAAWPKLSMRAPARHVRETGCLLTSRSEVTPTPKRIRCSRGRGTNAANRCMNSRGTSPGAWCRSARGLELQCHLSGDVPLHALAGQRRAGDVAARLLQRLAVIGGAVHSCA